jgi:hypothetical protein
MRVLIAVLVISLIPGVVSAKLLGTATVAHEFGTDLEAPFRVLPYFFLVSPGAVLFDETWLVESDIGNSQTATPLSDLDFVEITDRLTNGRVEEIWIGARLGSVGGGFGYNEYEWFELNTRDFKGSRIDSISLRLDHLGFEFPNFLGGTSVNYEFTIRVYGEGPDVAVLPVTWGRIKERYRDSATRYDD